MMHRESGVAFTMPGGETCGKAKGRPVDFDHLARQTMGDRDLEREVLALFVQQSLGLCEQIALADARQRKSLAHGLKGAARGVGAFAVADCADAIELHPDNKGNLKRLTNLVEDVRAFVAAINR